MYDIVASNVSKEKKDKQIVRSWLLELVSLGVFTGKCGGVLCFYVLAEKRDMQWLS
jgi:hypothetical protein